ncbi:unnamed protein product [Effrenium voratum]|nr:unnamed protein product [Effrenium voratum]
MPLDWDPEPIGLRASRAEAQQLAARLSSSSEALQQSRKQGEELAARARVVADERSHLENSLQATHQRELAALKEEHARALSELQRKTSEERSRLELEQQQALRAALDRASKAEAANEELNHTRQSLTASGESCQKRLAEAEKELNEAGGPTGQPLPELGEGDAVAQFRASTCNVMQGAGCCKQ